ncbi:unnamed protein product [Soboliphyme baturini]|uniref:LRRCT domain-containing protein n=1 Tax=Soboliphyme baturini TaxID=241478 RepID=A0A183IAZ6_9BILA|nr:unnamed protein product [Soboliphyme baturini]
MVVCDGKTLTEIPKSLFQNMRNLTIKNAFLGELPTNAFSAYPLLERLQISHSEVKRIHEFAFAGLPRLQFLYILNNPLSTLEPYSFSALNNVKEVLIRGNDITSISKFTFFNSKNIRGLDLRANPVTRIHSNAFSGLNNVQFLHVPEGVRDIEPDAFNNLTRVHFMDIRLWNANLSEFKGVASYTFRGLRYASSIRIYSSNLGVIRQGAFEEIETVETLQIRNSHIHRIQKGAFEGMHHVGSLDMVKNDIDFVDRSAFFDLPSENVHQFQLMENNFDCSCSNYWLFANYDTLDAGVLQRNYCSSPHNLLKMPLKAISAVYVKNCTDHMSDGENDEVSANGAPLTLTFSFLLALCLPLFLVLCNFDFVQLS